MGTDPTVKYACIAAIRDEGDLDEVGEVYVGSKEEAELRFEEALISGEYPNVYLCKVIRKAVCNWDIEDLPEE